MKENKENLNFGECLVELTKLDIECSRNEMKECALRELNRRREIYNVMSKQLSKVKGYKVGY